MKAAFTVVIPVGPGATHAARLVDLLDSLRFYEGGSGCRVCILDDGADLQPALDAVQWARPWTIVRNPRRGRGNGWAGGVAVGMLTVFKKLLDESRRNGAGFVLPIDTDALVIAPFSDRIREILRQKSSAGIIGSIRYLREPEQVKRDTLQMGKAIEKLAKPFTVWRRTPVGPPFLQAAWFPQSRLIRTVILRARAHGYRVGEQCCGGACALPFRTLEALAANGFLKHPMAWLRTPLTYDFVLSLMIKACGLDLCDCSEPGQPFAVRYQGLPDTPENLAGAGYAIIHSTKDRDGLKEESVREFFRQRRHR